MSLTNTIDKSRLPDSHEKYAGGRISRRDFIASAAITPVFLSGLLGSQAQASPVSQPVGPRRPSAIRAPVKLAAWSHFWHGIERVVLFRGTVANGQYMHVEYQVPMDLRHPYPIVLVHSNGGQTTDWMSTPDGRPGWFNFLLQEGYAVYLVDLPGLGRPPYHVDFHGPFGQSPTYENFEQNFTAISKKSMSPNLTAHLHTQWPGSGEIGDPALDQLMAAQGQAPGDLTQAHKAWRSGGATLLDKIGPAIIIAHGTGAPFAWLVADERPNMVKGIVAIEPAGPAFNSDFGWGLTSSRMTYRPVASEDLRGPLGGGQAGGFGQRGSRPLDIEIVEVTPSEPGVSPFRLQREPARHLPNLANIPIAVVTSEASLSNATDPGSAAYLRQVGCTVEHIHLADQAVYGNGHYMMLEKNNREALQPVLAWINKSVSTSNVSSAARLPKLPHTTDPTAVNLSDQGHFWTGLERMKMPYGTIAGGQMFVQYLIPEVPRHSYSVVLVAASGGQGSHWLGVVDGQACWAHYYLQEGYPVYIIDLPGAGHSPLHPDVYGNTGSQPRTYEVTKFEFLRAAANPFPKWSGTAEIGDPGLDQFVPGEAGPSGNFQTLWARGVSELLDTIGPAIIQTHTTSGAFGWIAADRRPQFVKAVIWTETAIPDIPFANQLPWGLTALPVAYDPAITDSKQLSLVEVTPPSGSGIPRYRLQAEPARKLKNLQNIPILVVSGEYAMRTQTPAIISFFKQAGCSAENIQLKDLGIRGNGALMMFETNRRQIFDVIHGWIEQKVPATV